VACLRTGAWWWITSFVSAAWVMPETTSKRRAIGGRARLRAVLGGWGQPALEQPLPEGSVFAGLFDVTVLLWARCAAGARGGIHWPWSRAWARARSGASSACVRCWSVERCGSCTGEPWQGAWRKAPPAGGQLTVATHLLGNPVLLLGGGVLIGSVGGPYRIGLHYHLAPLRAFNSWCLASAVFLD